MSVTGSGEGSYECVSVVFVVPSEWLITAVVLIERMAGVCL